MDFLFDIQTLIATYGYIGIFVVVFLESGIFFALPGDSLLFTAGILAAAGFLKILYVIPLIFVATFFGGIVGYYVGSYIEKLRKYRFFAKFLKKEHIDKTHIFMEKYGNLAVVAGRFVPIVRTFVPIVAGVASMDFKKYLKYNLIGSIVWSTSVTLVGFFLGRIFPNIKDQLHWLLIGVVVISILPMIFSFLKKDKSAEVEAK
ncbi:MAG: DedA family protein [Bacteroidetes bacterium]|nr:DedA family protein [Bacteroidota bacterium]MBS3922945.1 DedA family protein [Nitrosarchaeum sp.]